MSEASHRRLWGVQGPGWRGGAGRSLGARRRVDLLCLESLEGRAVSFGTSYCSHRIWPAPHVPAGVAASQSPGASPAFRSRNVLWPQVTRASGGAFSDQRWPLPPWRRLSRVFSFPQPPHPKFLAPSPLPSPLPPARLPTLRAGWWAHPGSQQPGVCPCEQRRKPTGLRGTGARGKEAAVATEGQLHDERARLLRATESSSRRSVDALNS